MVAAAARQALVVKLMVIVLSCPHHSKAGHDELHGDETDD